MKTSPSDGINASPSDGTNISSSSSGVVLSFPNLYETDENKLLSHGHDTGKHVRTRLPWINANHLFQMTTGLGRQGVLERGK